MKLGTCVKITDTLNVAPDGVVITITDPAGTVKVNEEDMTQDSATEYSYIYQSAGDDVEGRYIVVTKATLGSLEAVSETDFRLDALT